MRLNMQNPRRRRAAGQRSDVNRANRNQHKNHNGLAD